MTAFSVKPFTNHYIEKKITVNSQNTKQSSSIQVTLTLETNLQKEHFLAKYDVFHIGMRAF